MSREYPDEPYHQISLTEYFSKEIKPNLFAVSRVFSAARKQMNLAEYKTFYLALSRIKWKEPCPDTLYLNKKEVAKVVGIESDIDHLSVDLNRAIGEMPKHSFLKFADKDNDIYINGNFVRTIAMFKNVVRIRLEDEFLSLFGNLDKNYITMWSEDVFRMRSERSVLFYEFLREESDTRKDINTTLLGIEKFKDMFDIPKDGKGSYMRENGGFDRTNFEKRVIEPLCEDLQKCQAIHLVCQQNGKTYEKIKDGKRVVGYRFYWTYSAHPAVAAAEEVKELQERVDKNPAVLKVAKDIIKGEKKPKQRKKNGFNDFQQREYDFDALEKTLLSNG